MKWILNKTSLGFIRAQEIEKYRRPILNTGALLHELGNSPSQLNFVIFYSFNSCNTCLESLGCHLSQLQQVVITGAVTHLKSLPRLTLIPREQEGWASSSLWTLSPSLSQCTPVGLLLVWDEKQLKEKELGGVLLKANQGLLEKPQNLEWEETPLRLLSKLESPLLRSWQSLNSASP